jgi:excisionase family DNA binding protein
MDKDYLTTRQVAERLEVAYTTVMGWIERGLIPVEEREESRGKIYLVPTAALKDFKKPQAGRPPKQEPAAATRKRRREK